jgi:Uma2 family endonuclease
MGSAGFVPVEEYLRYTAKPNCEYFDGVVQPKALATIPHAWAQTKLLLILTDQGKIALPEVTVQVSGTRFFVPDVTVVGKLQSPYPTDPAELCVEILSPEDRVGTMLAKVENYHTWGVPYCWVIDPEKRVGWEYHAGSDPARIESSGTLRAGAMAVSVEDLWPKL